MESDKRPKKKLTRTQIRHMVVLYALLIFLAIAIFQTDWLRSIFFLLTMWVYIDIVDRIEEKK